MSHDSIPQPSFDAATAAELTLPARQRALRDALLAAGISAVRAEYDGCGDSGQLESVSLLTLMASSRPNPDDGEQAWQDVTPTHDQPDAARECGPFFAARSHGVGSQQ